MTDRQRAALLELTRAILACDCADAAMRGRATALQFRLQLGAAIGRIFA